MDESGRIWRWIELDHPVNVYNINTSGHDICSHQQAISFQLPELVKYFVAILFHFAVYAKHLERR